MLETLHHQEWVRAIEGWRKELHAPTGPLSLHQHCQRTVRALGGMGSIGEIALMYKDHDFTTLIDSLYAICKRILSSEE
jgi:hypothetical protein